MMKAANTLIIYNGLEPEVKDLFPDVPNKFSLSLIPDEFEYKFQEGKPDAPRVAMSRKEINPMRILICNHSSSVIH